MKSSIAAILLTGAVGALGEGWAAPSGLPPWAPTGGPPPWAPSGFAPPPWSSTGTGSFPPPPLPSNATTNGTSLLDCDMSQGADGLYYKTFTTGYPAFCPSGMMNKSYTITESCTDAAWTPDGSYIPTGFTTTVSVCTECGPTPITATLTAPCVITPPPSSAPFPTTGSSATDSLSTSATPSGPSSTSVVPFLGAAPAVERSFGLRIMAGLAALAAGGAFWL